jgi:hypothetical protein
MRCNGERVIGSPALWAMLSTFPLLAQVSPTPPQTSHQLSVDQAKQADALQSGREVSAGLGLPGAWSIQRSSSFERTLSLTPDAVTVHEDLGSQRPPPSGKPQPILLGWP